MLSEQKKRSKTRKSILRVQGKDVEISLKPLNPETYFHVVGSKSTKEGLDRAYRKGIDALRSPTSEDEDEIEKLDEKFDRYGFRISVEGTSGFHRSKEVSAELLRERRSKEASRLLKWHEMLHDLKCGRTSKVKAAEAKLQERTRKGIPNDKRGEAWYYICGAENVNKDIPNPEARMTGEDGKCVVPVRTLDEIERDIDRTYPAHSLFREDGGKETEKQKSLRKVLQWYAAIDPDVGYCQGMGFVAGLYLLYMDEKRAFNCFYRALQMESEIKLRDLYLPQMVEAQRVLFVFKRLGRQHLGRLWQHLEKQELDPTMYATEWAMTMFCRGFHFDLVTRVMDIYLLEGYKVVFRVMLALMKNVEESLINAPFEEIMEILRNIPELTDADTVMDIAYSIHVRRSDISKYAAEYDDMRAKERKSVKF